MVYQWKSGSRIKADAQSAGEVCARLEAEGRLTASDLVEESRPEDAPLHSSFEWRDDVAAEEWRMYQARNIIHSIIVIRNDDMPQQVYYNISPAAHNYESIETIVRNEDKYEQLKQQAFRELQSFERRYQTILELSKVFDAIDELLADVS